MQPNFLVVIVDQMNSFSLGWNGNDEVRTPNLTSWPRQESISIGPTPPIRSASPRGRPCTPA